MKEVRNAFELSVGNSEGQRPLMRSGRGCYFILKWRFGIGNEKDLKICNV
jgi:hypothetical protein